LGQLGSQSLTIVVENEKANTALKQSTALSKELTAGLMEIHEVASKPVKPMAVKINIPKGAIAEEVISDEQRRIEDERRTRMAEQNVRERSEMAAMRAQERAALASVKMPPMGDEQKYWKTASVMVTQLTANTLEYDAAVKKLMKDGMSAKQVMAYLSDGFKQVEASTGRAIPPVQKVEMEINLLRTVLRQASAEELPMISRRLELLNREFGALTGKGFQAHRQGVRELTMRYQHLTGGLIALSMVMTSLAGDVDKGTEKQKAFKKGLQEGSRTALELTFMLSMMGPKIAMIAGPVGILAGALIFLHDAFKKTDAAAEVAEEGVKDFAKRMVEADNITLTTATAVLTEYGQRLKNATEQARKLREERIKEASIKIGAAAPMMGGALGAQSQLTIAATEYEKVMEDTAKDAQLITEELEKQIAVRQEQLKWDERAMNALANYSKRYVYLNSQVEYYDKLVKSGTLEEEKIPAVLEKKRRAALELKDIYRDQWTISNDELTTLKLQHDIGLKTAQEIINKLHDMKKLAVGNEALVIDKEILTLEKAITDERKKRAEAEWKYNQDRIKANQKFFHDQMKAAAESADLMAEMAREMMGSDLERQYAAAEKAYRDRIAKIGATAAAANRSVEWVTDAERLAFEAWQKKKEEIEKTRITRVTDYERELDDIRIGRIQNTYTREIEEERQADLETHLRAMEAIRQEYELTQDLQLRRRREAEENQRHEDVKRRRQTDQTARLTKDVMGEVGNLASQIQTTFNIAGHTFVGQLLKALDVMNQILSIVQTIVALIEMIETIRAVTSVVSAGAGYGPATVPGGGGGVGPLLTMERPSYRAGGETEEEEYRPGLREGQPRELVVTGSVDISNGKIFLRQEMPRYKKYEKRKMI